MMAAEFPLESTRRKISTVEVVFSTLGAGGKFDHKDGSPIDTSGGLHGVGASVVNFLSEWMEIEVSRDGAGPSHGI